MAEDKAKEEGQAEVPKHGFGAFTEYPPREFPVIYTDGISSWRTAMATLSNGRMLECSARSSCATQYG